MTIGPKGTPSAKNISEYSTKKTTMARPTPSLLSPKVIKLTRRTVNPIPSHSGGADESSTVGFAVGWEIIGSDFA